MKCVFDRTYSVTATERSERSGLIRVTGGDASTAKTAARSDPARAGQIGETASRTSLNI